ncbi:hypothetical protein U1Q18_028579 [Sarracenia purpurea var. burkii]
MVDNKEKRILVGSLGLIFLASYAISGKEKKRRAPAEKTSGDWRNSDAGFSWLIGVDRCWVSVENKAAEGHRGSGSVSAKEKTTSQARGRGPGEDPVWARVCKREEGIFQL